jgi:ubiquinone/menaquinone biosynthesis C-methylase UbiE
MSEKETAEDWSVRTWKERHVHGYFPRSKEHRGWRVYEHVPEWLSERIYREDVVLDLGCGYAQWLIPLVRLCKPAKAYGVDIHTIPLEKGRSLLMGYGIGDVELKLGDGLTIPYPDLFFDKIYSISVFQHLPRSLVSGYVRETDRALKSGGVAMHHFRNADNVGPFPTPAEDITANHHGDFSCGWTESQIRQEADKVGWKCEIVPDNAGLCLVMIGTKP